MGRVLRKRLTALRRCVFELCRSQRYSYTALNNIDRQLERYLSFRDGFFVEAGANDGVSQSNTYFFERMRGWSGILVEAVPSLYHECVRTRTNAQVYNCALVANDYEDATVELKYADLMSVVAGARGAAAAEEAHVERWLQLEPRGESYSFRSPARTLTSILDEASVQAIDLLSLDVEGYELQVLRGLDLQRYPPTYILVEANFREAIDSHLAQSGYFPIDELSHHDVLYSQNY